MDLYWGEKREGDLYLEGSLIFSKLPFLARCFRQYRSNEILGKNKNKLIWQRSFFIFRRLKWQLYNDYCQWRQWSASCDVVWVAFLWALLTDQISINIQLKNNSNIWTGYIYIGLYRGPFPTSQFLPNWRQQ